MTGAVGSQVHEVMHGTDECLLDFCLWPTHGTLSGQPLRLSVLGPAVGLVTTGLESSYAVPPRLENTTGSAMCEGPSLRQP